MDCLICGNEISGDGIAYIYLNPQDNSWNIEGSTPFLLEVSPCCGQKQCVEMAWEKAKLSTVGGIELSNSSESDDSINSWEENDASEAEWEKIWRLREEFDQSDIAKQVDDLHNELWRLKNLDKYKAAFDIARKIIDLTPSHLKYWIDTVGDITQYNNPLSGLWEQAVRTYVVLRGEDGIRHIISVLGEMHRLSNGYLYDMEIVEHDERLFINDMMIFKVLLKYIRDNPKTPQKKLYKTLSLEGRKTSYMLEYAHQMEIISRTRHHDTWLLELA